MKIPRSKLHFEKYEDSVNWKTLNQLERITAVNSLTNEASAIICLFSFWIMSVLSLWILVDLYYGEFTPMSYTGIIGFLKGFAWYINVPILVALIFVVPLVLLLIFGLVFQSIGKKTVKENNPQLPQDETEMARAFVNRMNGGKMGKCRDYEGMNHVISILFSTMFFLGPVIAIGIENGYVVFLSGFFIGLWVALFISALIFWIVFYLISNFVILNIIENTKYSGFINLEKQYDYYYKKLIKLNLKEKERKENTVLYHI